MTGIELHGKYRVSDWVRITSLGRVVFKIWIALYREREVLMTGNAFYWEVQLLMIGTVLHRACREDTYLWWVMTKVNQLDLYFHGRGGGGVTVCNTREQLNKLMNISLFHSWLQCNGNHSWVHSFQELTHLPFPLHPTTVRGVTYTSYLRNVTRIIY